MGVTKELVKSGTGPYPRVGQHATFHLTVLGKNGDPTNKLWSTRDQDQPFAMRVGKEEYVPAIDEGLFDMQVGEVTRLTCTKDWATRLYEDVPPNKPVVLEIELLMLEDDDLQTSGEDEEPEEEEEEKEKEK